jgi:hypothetical protein
MSVFGEYELSSFKNMGALDAFLPKITAIIFFENDSNDIY